MNRFPIPEWAADIDDAQFTDPAKVKTRAAKFERTIKRRNVLEYAAGGLAVVLFGGLSIGALSKAEYFIAAAGALCVACTVYVLFQLNKRGSSIAARPEESCLAHLRGQYERQYHALRTVPQWYLAPIGLGLFGYYALFAVQYGQRVGLEKALDGIWHPLLGTAALFAFFWWLNARAARSLKQRIDQIDALG